MTRTITIARAILGTRPLIADRDVTLHESGRLALARYVLSIPTLIAAWRDEATACEERGEGARAKAIRWAAGRLETL